MFEKVLGKLVNKWADRVRERLLRAARWIAADLRWKLLAWEPMLPLLQPKSRMALRPSVKPMLEGLEGRIAPATFTFTGGSTAALADYLVNG
jgi:hypothetical protein